MKNFCIAVVVLFLSALNAHASNWNKSESIGVSDTELRLDCQTNNYSLAEYPKEWAISWVPEQHSIMISRSKIRSLTVGAEGKVVRETNKRIEFIFDSFSDSRHDGAVLKGVYFRSSRKFMVRVQTNGRYRQSGPIWGVCKEIDLNSENKTAVTHQSSPLLTLETVKKHCTELGFLKGTEKHGDCVLALLKAKE